MVRRDKSHACVLWYSLGNESGYGTTHDEMAAWARRHDPRTLVFYESCGAGGATDVLCPMYYADFLVAKMDSLKGQVILDFSPTRRFPNSLPDGVGMRPVILSEWTHAMGNATGNYAEWWELFRSMEHVQGGFIWAWADEAVRLTSPAGQRYFGYGGDCGEKVHNHTFCLNGLVSPDRVPHPALFEVKHVNAPVSIALRSHSYERSEAGLRLSVDLEVTNRFDVLSLGEVTGLLLTATLELNGISEREACLKVILAQCAAGGAKVPPTVIDKGV